MITTKGFLTTFLAFADATLNFNPKSQTTSERLMVPSELLVVEQKYFYSRGNTLTSFTSIRLSKSDREKLGEISPFNPIT